MQFANTSAFAQELDSKDALAHFKQEFHVPKNSHGKDKIYFCGNSLGLMPKSASSNVQNELIAWQTLGVDAHFEAQKPWLDYHKRSSELLTSLLGAKKEEIVAMGSLSANLHFLLASFYRPTSFKNQIWQEKSPFPSDYYVAESQIRFHGFNPDDCLFAIGDSDKTFVETEYLIDKITQNKDSIALLFLGGVNYLSGQVFEIQKIAACCQELNIVFGLDLAHAVGNVELHLHDWGVDFAAWCSYKYLNAGPGGVAGIFVHEKHHNNASLPKLTGWWGHKQETRFKMDCNFDPSLTAESWQLSNAPVINMAILEASLEIFNRAGFNNLLQKSKVLTQYLRFLLNDDCAEDVEIITPASNQGAQLSIAVNHEPNEVYKLLLKNNIIVDWREPNIIRIAPVPLYNTFTDVYQFVHILKQIIHSLKGNS